MDIILQIWGESFYLINKICFAFAEGKKGNRKRQFGRGLKMLTVN